MKRYKHERNKRERDRGKRVRQTDRDRGGDRRNRAQAREEYVM